MDDRHPNQYDKRPKRRKDKDNPYLQIGLLLLASLEY